MIELEDKWFWAYPTESVDCDGITGSELEVYSKSDADAVIAYLQNQLLLARTSSIKSLAKAQHEAHHNKYKRCLAMAKMCDEVMMSCELRGYTVLRIWANKHEWAMRWKYRWLELSEKFKEAK